MKKVTTGGLVCFADSLRKAPHQGCVFLSLFGPRNSVKGAWARLVGRRRSAIYIGDDYLSLEDGARYVTLNKTLKGDNLHLVLIHPNATNQVSVHSSGFFHLGPRDGWFEKFNRMTAIPLKEEWESFLWRKGLAADLIKPCAGFGLPAVTVSVADHLWGPLVTQGVCAGELK